MTFAVHDGDWLARPNVSMTRRGRRLLFLGIAAISLLIAVGFALVGAWMVLPFAGLEILALGFALIHLERHADDFEAVHLRGGRLTVEVRDGKECTREDCAACWMRFFLCRPAETGATRLRFKAHGRHVDVGRWMSEEQLGALAAELRLSVLSPLRTPPDRNNLPPPSQKENA